VCEKLVRMKAKAFFCVQIYKMVLQNSPGLKRRNFVSGVFVSHGLHVLPEFYGTTLCLQKGLRGMFYGSDKVEP
jgi:hypothetical protein